MEEEGHEKVDKATRISRTKRTSKGQETDVRVPGEFESVRGRKRIHVQAGAGGHSEVDKCHEDCV